MVAPGGGPHGHGVTVGTACPLIEDRWTLAEARHLQRHPGMLTDCDPAMVANRLNEEGVAGRAPSSPGVTRPPRHQKSAVRSAIISGRCPLPATARASGA